MFRNDVIAQKSLFAGESDFQIYVLERFLKLTPDFIIMQERSLFLVVFMSVLCVLRESAVTDADQGTLMIMKICIIIHTNRSYHFTNPAVIIDNGFR